MCACTRVTFEQARAVPSQSSVRYKRHLSQSPCPCGGARPSDVRNHKNMAATHTRASRLMGGRTHLSISLTRPSAARPEYTLASLARVYFNRHQCDSAALCTSHADVDAHYYALRAACMQSVVSRRRFVFDSFFFFSYFFCHPNSKPIQMQ